MARRSWERATRIGGDPVSRALDLSHRHRHRARRDGPWRLLAKALSSPSEPVELLRAPETPVLACAAHSRSSSHSSRSLRRSRRSVAPRLEIAVPVATALKEGPAIVTDGLLSDDKTREHLRNGFPARIHYRLELWRKGGVLAGDDRVRRAGVGRARELRSDVEPLQHGPTVERRFAIARTSALQHLVIGGDAAREAVQDVAASDRARDATTTT